MHSQDSSTRARRSRNNANQFHQPYGQFHQAPADIQDMGIGLAPHPSASLPVCLSPQPQPHPATYYEQDGQSLSVSLDAFDIGNFFPQHNDYESVSDPNPVPFAYASPNSASSASESTNPLHPSVDENSPSSSQPPKRKRENRYRNAPPGVLSRRRAQNRASQRAYRERKEQRIRDLEQLLQESQTRQETLSQAYLTLQQEYGRLRAEHGQHAEASLPQQDSYQVYSQYPPVSGADASSGIVPDLNLHMGLRGYHPSHSS